MNTPGSPGSKAFTLVELVAVVAIVAILVALALPSYREYLVRTNRTQAIAALLDLAACQERVFAMSGRYDTTRCMPDQLDRYSVRIEPANDSRSLVFNAWADPLGGQSSDECGSLGIDQAGLRSTTGENSEADKCWSGR